MKKLLVVIVALVAMAFVADLYAATATTAPGGGASTGSTQGRFGQKEAFTTALGQAKEQVAEGTVVSHDVACHCIVLQTSSGNLVVQDDYAKFNQEYNKAKGLKIGERAKITYKTVDYINYATLVEQK